MENCKNFPVVGVYPVKKKMPLPGYKYKIKGKKKATICIKKCEKCEDWLRSAKEGEREILEDPTDVRRRKV